MNPIVVLVQPQLEGSKNFHAWISSKRVALISKNNMIFMDGTIKALEKTHSLYNQWFRCNTMVLAWIQRSVCANVVNSIVFFDKGYDIWKDLHDWFYQGDMSKLTQGTRDVSDYYTKLKALWDDELDNFSSLPSCSCVVPCSCGAIKWSKTFCDQSYTIKFLKGLNE